MDNEEAGNALHSKSSGLTGKIDGLIGLCDQYFKETLSAVNRRRRVYEQVIALLEPGDMLVIWDLDRAFRSAKDALNELDALNKRGVNSPLPTSTWLRRRRKATLSTP